MSSRLSFAQILQKKQIMEQSQNSHFLSSQVIQQQPNTKSLQEITSLAEMMEEYLQYQEAPETNFVLSFVGDDLNNSGHSQDFGVGQNPLDSWIMTQSNFQTNKSNKFPTSKKVHGQNKGNSIMEMSKKYAKARQNSNVIYDNNDDEFKFSSRAYERSIQNLERYENSQGQTNPMSHNKLIKNIQMIENAEFVQSQACGYAQVVPGPNNANVKPIKKASQEQENLMTGIDDLSQNDSKQKRIEDARQQIKEYLKLKGKSTDASQTSSIKNFQYLKRQQARTEEPEVEEAKISKTHVNYSFAQCEEQRLENRDSFPNTKQKLHQIKEENQVRENERMLSCIQYAQSEADGEEHTNEIIHEGDENQYNYGQMELNQSIPETKQRVTEHIEPSALGKYIPASGSIEQFSEMVQKIDVQSSIVENVTSKDGDSMSIMNSDKLGLKQLCRGGVSKNMDKPQQVGPVYHDVSSIDIQVSQQVNIQLQSPLPSKQPVSNENNNLRAHTQGFIYAMKINSRNSSFTSSFYTNHNGKSRSGSHSCLQQVDNNQIVNNLGTVGVIKNNGKIVEIQASKEDKEKQIRQQVEDPEKKEQKVAQFVQKSIGEAGRSNEVPETQNLFEYESAHVETKASIIPVPRDLQRKDVDLIVKGSLKKASEGSESFRFDLDF